MSSDVSGWEVNHPMQNAPWPEYNDPCPENYRLPTTDEFITLSNETIQTNGGGWIASDYGYKIFTSGKVSLEFLAFGRRNGTIGALNFQGVNGYYWSSTNKDEEYGHNMFINNDHVTKSSTSYKLLGFGVRCVRK